MASVQQWPGMRSEYAWLPAHDDDMPTVTGANQIGVSFGGHRDLVYATGGRSRAGDIRPGSVIVSGGAPIEWLRVRESTEALEIYLEPALLPPAAGLMPRIGGTDGTVLGIASVLRRVHAAGAGLSDIAASTLAHRLAGHLSTRYAGIRPPGVATGRLSGAAVDRVAELVEARLHGVLTLDDLAAVARLSPYHFSRAFRASTGLAPYAFVTARRMDRARRHLAADRTVEEAAAAVGFGNLSHFRRTFRRHHGLPPATVRQQESTFRARPTR